MTKFTRKADKRQAKLQRTARTTVSSEASDVLIDVDKANDVAANGKGAGAQGKAAGKAKGKGKGGAASVGEIDENDADHVDEAVHSSEAFDMTANASAEQKKLIKAAFADDDVIEEEFAEEKAKLTDQQTIKDKDVTLPGWGVWGGHGVVNAKPQKRIIKKAPKQARRKDDGKKNVIINQRKNKKLNSKLIDQVPYPYTNPQQLERTIAQPIGKEWNSMKVFDDATTARVTTKAGTIIAPMQLTKGVKAAGAKRKVAIAEKVAKTEDYRERKKKRYEKKQAAKAASS